MNEVGYSVGQKKYLVTILNLVSSLHYIIFLFMLRRCRRCHTNAILVVYNIMAVYCVEEPVILRQKGKSGTSSIYRFSSIGTYRK